MTAVSPYLRIFAFSSAALALLWLIPTPKPAAAAVPGVQFEDDNAKSNLTLVTRNDYRKRKYFIQPMAGGVSLLDVDGDGKLDIFITNGAELPSQQKTSPAFYNALWRNTGTGWEDRTAAAHLDGKDLGYSIGTAAGDFDNDGHPDLFIAGAGRNALYHNNGDGTFSDITEASGAGKKAPGILSVGAAWFDYDHDGRLDLAVINYTQWTPEKDLQCVDPLLGERYCSPTRYVSVPNQLFHNLGNGKFTEVTQAAGLSTVRGKGMGIAIADFNQDGFEDMLVVNDTERNFLYLNQGNGTFKEQGFLYGVALNDDGVTVNGMGLDAKDFNNDGLIDVFYNDLPTQTWALFLNAGKAFRYASVPTGLAKLSFRLGGWSAGFIDYDNDGWKDLYSANGDVDYFGDNAKQSDSMFRNINGKTVQDVTAAMGPAFVRKGYHRGSAFGDLNDDGSMDMIVTALNERPRILRNTGTPGNHWALFELTGRTSNRDAIGAQLKLTTSSGRILYNHVTTAVGYMSSSDKRVHFGLGRENAIRDVEIRWPSGRLQNLGAVKADAITRVTEPAK